MLVSVVIPTYNRRHTIAPAIDSALAQRADGIALEVLVVDDASTDATADWLPQAYAGQPVRLLRNQGLKGPAGGRNTGIAAARGELVALLDSDDQFLPGHLAQALAAFAAHPELGLVFGRARYERNGVREDYMGPNFERKLAAAGKSHVDAGLVVFDERFVDHLLRDGCWFNLSSVVLRAEAARLRMDERLRISEDYEFWVRLARSHRFGCLLDEQIRYALHDENISFEADASAEGHAPRLLLALEIIRGHAGVDAAQRALIDDQRATVLADWAYRCRLHRRWREAAALHWRSLRLGRVAPNLLALAKLPLHALRPGP